ncbi:macrolide 2'-phosphotransferase [Jeotgalibacillus sp. ET6]|uniref:macrolide 2'-phosphotransferase n=1 Tax=Jeotgalibacillus sp. ET6 TaxID=3037260 RepID=UPI0024186066|nr:macrolide 2'-phosphotransferase [Jeotgalibacillus sp. ET6]MDG5472137.1 macrolide 2'-phosphotransferase [Jeotgalibacillus sp. ET6]
MTLSKKRAVDLAGKHGFKVKEETLTFNESGLDFLVVFATDVNNQKWVLRIPRREDVFASTKKEKNALDWIEPKISFEAPKWQVWTEELIAYKQLSGIPAGTIDPEAKAYKWEIDEKNVSPQFTQSLAKAMVSLHQLDPIQAQKAGLKMDSAENLRKDMKARMEKVKEEFGVGQTLWERWQAWVEDESFWPRQIGVFHGDLHAGHILINEKEQVTGFIDWTEAGAGDVSQDFVAHYRTFGENELKKLLSAYETAGGYVWPKMAAHILELEAAYPVAIAEFAIKSGIEEYLDMARAVLGVEK